MAKRILLAWGLNRRRSGPRQGLNSKYQLASTGPNVDAQSQHVFVLGDGFALRGRTEPLRQVVDRVAECGEVGIVDLGNIDLEPLAQSSHQIEEVHRVDVELFARVGIRIEPCRIDLGSDPAEFINENSGDVVECHSVSGLCSRRSISARNRAPRWPSLARWSAARVAVSTRRAATSPATAQGRSTGMPKPTSATWGG